MKPVFYIAGVGKGKSCRTRHRLPAIAKLAPSIAWYIDERKA